MKKYLLAIMLSLGFNAIYAQSPVDIKVTEDSIPQKQQLMVDFKVFKSTDHSYKLLDVEVVALDIADIKAADQNDFTRKLFAKLINLLYVNDYMNGKVIQYKKNPADSAGLLAVRKNYYIKILNVR